MDSYFRGFCCRFDLRRKRSDPTWLGTNASEMSGPGKRGVVLANEEQECIPRLYVMIRTKSKYTERLSYKSMGVYPVEIVIVLPSRRHNEMHPLRMSTLKSEEINSAKLSPLFSVPPKRDGSTCVSRRKVSDSHRPARLPKLGPPAGPAGGPPRASSVPQILSPHSPPTQSRVGQHQQPDIRPPPPASAASPGPGCPTGEVGDSAACTGPWSRPSARSGSHRR